MTTVYDFKGFMRWAALGGKHKERIFIDVAEKLAELPLREGFEFKRHAFDSSGPPPYAINLERASISGVTDYFYIGFDRYHRFNFHVLFGTKKTDRPHEWVRAGSLVWRSGADDVKYKIWGARWWQPRKIEVFTKEAIRASGLMQQAVCYLDTGEIGANVFPEK